MCRTLAAQIEWVRADWLLINQKSPLPSLEAAKAKALLSTRSPEPSLDTWQTLAEAHLRLAQANKNAPETRALHLDAGLAAVEKAFVMNPSYALALGTRGALQLIKAEAARDLAVRQSAAQAAIASLAQAIQSDPFLSQEYTPLVETARALQSVP